MSGKQYRVCPECGAALDAHEVCDCQKTRDPEADPAAELQRKSDQLQEQIIEGIRKDAEIRRLTAELEEANARLLLLAKEGGD